MTELNELKKLAEYQQFSELKARCLTALQQSPNEDSVLNIQILLANAYAHLGERTLAEKALLTFNQLTKTLAPESLIEANTNKAAVLIAIGKLDEAVECLKAILAIEPEHMLALARLGFCAMTQQNTQQAIAYLQQSVDLASQGENKFRLPILNNVISLYLQDKQLENAQINVELAQQALQAQQADLPDNLYQQYWQQTQIYQLNIWVDLAQYEIVDQWLNENSERLEEAHFLYFVSVYSRALAAYDQHEMAFENLNKYFQQFPENVSLCIELSELAQVLGHFMQAINFLRKAIKLNKQDDSKQEEQKNIDGIKLWTQLSNACLHRFEQQAKKAAEKAIELANTLTPSDTLSLKVIGMQKVKAKSALAHVLTQEKEYDGAEALYQEILAEYPDFLPALQGLGQQFMQQGNIDDAVALFERVKSIDPLKGHSSLINARKFPEDVATLDKMEAAAQMPSLEGSMRSSILFQLASAWEKRKDYDKAMNLAKKANDATRKFLPYDAKAHRNECFRVRTRFTQALYEHRKDCGVDSSLPVYILGMPRSGTTLIEQILSGHSDIFGAGELGVIPQVKQGLNRWERHTGSGRRYPDCIDDLNAYTTKGIAEKILKELQEFSPESKHIVDKLPHNFENVGLIKFLFPHAKIISVRRDPRDIALSNYFTDYQAKHGGMGFAYDLETIGQQLADHNMMMHHWDQVFPGEILTVNYEDVVDDIEGSARKMLKYIGVDWQPECLKFNELKREVKTASVWQVRQPLYKTSKAKWKRYERHLAPLIKGSNAPILPDNITDMITLPVPAFLTDGVAFYQNGQLDEAEICFKKMLHHNPEHAACNYMTGLVYLSKNHSLDGIAFIEKALAITPWHNEWQHNLLKAYERVGDEDKIAAFYDKYPKYNKQSDEHGVINAEGVSDGDNDIDRNALLNEFTSLSDVKFD